MKLSTSLAVLGITAATKVSAEVFVVKTLSKPSFQFSPNIVFAEVGDYVEFHFGPKNHSVAQGSFSKACAPPHSGGFFSGYIPVEEGEGDKVFKILIENKDPIAFYCTQGTHCATGMYGIVNPTKEASGQAYFALVSELGQQKAVEPARAAPFGGALIDNPNLAGNGSSTKTDADGASGTATATGGFTTNPSVVDPPPTGTSTGPVVTGADVAAGSEETDGSGSAGALVRAPTVGFAAALGLALLLA
ncbi:uncharacterized protein DNG_02953 [Cephalotrichum gorgonifer]|uniref:Extracellular serine-rich protein n=1 Tax=Cephalotrichum gorgonifer TaxID=2041049 RepID=A0AAE8ST45_9PEZI|nr:uncharacterized protein DNG_02953 [Cephalotrichum gorgonifer]